MTEIEFPITHLVDYDDRVYAKVVTDALRQWRFEKPEVEGITYRLPINFI